MSVTVKIPVVMRKLTDGQEEVQAEGATLREVVESLAQQNTEIKARLLKEDGEVNERIAVIFVNDEDARFLQKMDTPIQEGDEVLIVPALSGGGPNSASTIVTGSDCGSCRRTVPY